MIKNLSNVPDVDFAIKDTDLIASDLISVFENSSGRTLYPGDPLRLLILTFANEISLQRSNIDFTGKQNLLKYSGEGYLDNLGAILGVERLQPNFATATFEFNISESQPSVISIPKGTRITNENKIIFATNEICEIQVGSTNATAECTCLVIGKIGNGYLVGQINKIIDPFPYFKDVQNITISDGGADIEDLESFRERIREAPEGFSVAGPYGAYEFWAKSASPLISDVSVDSPSPGVVELIPLLINGEIPTAEIMNDVFAICNDSTKRPLTDKVIVSAPQVEEFSIDFNYYISSDDASVALKIQNNVENAVQEYILWQKEVLGRDINDSKLLEFLMNAGVKRIEISQPVFTKLNFNQLAVASNININYGGIEDD